MQAVVRFYAELKCFLAAKHHSGTVTHTFDVPGSVKDVIERYGVPHTEVDLILANGEPVDFSYRVMDEDRITVYPLFETLDLSTVVRVRPRALSEVRFVLDVHLGRLAGYLRLLGFDTAWSGEWSDHQLVQISTAQQRMLLTRDVGLLKHGSITHGYFVRAVNPRRQLSEVVRRFHLADQISPFTRCMECNGSLEPAEKHAIADRLPPGTRQHFDEYRTCTTCERIYWRGSHYRRLTEIVEGASRPGA